MTAQPEPGSCWTDRAGTYWRVICAWKNPTHQPYHIGWTGEYVVIQPQAGLLSELPHFVYLPDFAREFTLAWEPSRRCQFCGFVRMAPCKVRQACPNLNDLSFTEPDDASEIRS